MSQVLIGAMAGAIAGGVVSVVIEFLKWLLARRSQRRSLQAGFYFEIENHEITELESDRDGSPNFALTVFQDSVFKSDLSLAMTLLKPELLQSLIFYYAKLTSVVAFQNLLSDVTSALNKCNDELSRGNQISDARKAEMKNLLIRRDGIRDVRRLILAAAQYTRENLLSELKKDFKEDPSKKQFIDVMPKHKEWFDKIQKEGLSNPDQH